MSRETFALLLLAALIAISAWNIKAVEILSCEIILQLDAAEKSMLAGDRRDSENQFNAALQRWLSAKSYTHIFIRHPEIDSCTDAFFELGEAIASKTGDEAGPCFDKLRYHLESIASMERLSLGNIF